MKSIKHALYIRTVLYALLAAARLWNFQRLFITARRHWSILEIEKTKCHQIDFLSFTFKPEVLSSSKMSVVTKGTNQVLLS